MNSKFKASAIAREKAVCNLVQANAIRATSPALYQAADEAYETEQTAFEAAVAGMSQEDIDAGLRALELPVYNADTEAA